MKLADQIVQCRTPVIVENTVDKTTVRLHGAADSWSAVVACPTRKAAKNSRLALTARSALALAATEAIRIGLLIGAASLAAACATRDHVPPTPPRSSSPTGTGIRETSLPSTTSAPTAKTARASGDEVPVSQDLVKRGYRPKRRSGQLLYCQTQVLTGTHFSNTVCLTEAQIKALDLDTQSSKDRMGRQTQMPCPTSACN
jgi:hypothetical protein